MDLFGAFGENITFKVTGINPKYIKESFGRKKIRHEVINSYPIIEDMGETDRVIELTIEIATPFCKNPEKTFQELVNIMDSNKAEPLIIGKTILGDFVIESIEKETEYNRIGETIKISANLKLVEFREIYIKETKKEQKDNGRKRVYNKRKR